MVDETVKMIVIDPIIENFVVSSRSVDKDDPCPFNILCIYNPLYLMNVAFIIVKKCPTNGDVIYSYSNYLYYFH